MFHVEFKTYITNNVAHYAYVLPGILDLAQLSLKNVAFPKDLMAFLDLDMGDIRTLFEGTADHLDKFLETRSAEDMDIVRRAFLTMPQYHNYFYFIFLDWTRRLEEAAHKNYLDVDELLPTDELAGMPYAFEELQEQIKDLFAHVLDMDGENKSVQDRLTEYYKTHGDEAFVFRPQPMGFEMVYDQEFAEVLCPETIFDIIDYHTRECVKREVKMRRCKNCGRWFAVSGHLGTEYCDRPADKKGRTCKEVGAAAVWTKSKDTDEVFKAYRREYKKRFNWIKAGKITQEEFNAWSVEARKKKSECDEGKISLDEFSVWLKES